MADGPRTWRPVHRAAAAELGSDLEARWLVEEASGGVWPAVLDEAVPVRAHRSFLTLLRRRLAGEPVQYVLGHWAFRRLDLLVDTRVLIPRPETEQVVDVAGRELDRLRAIQSTGFDGRRGRLTVADLGTGSGAIALALAAEHPDVEVWAIDASPDAVAVARANTAGLAGSAATRVRVIEGSWWSALPPEHRGHIHLAVSNPPYIAAPEMATLDAAVVDWEPRGALEAGPTGLEDIAAVLAGAPAWLAPAGAVVVELAPHQAGEARRLAAGAGLVEITVHPDLAGRDRALVARRPR